MTEQAKRRRARASQQRPAARQGRQTAAKRGPAVPTASPVSPDPARPDSPVREPVATILRQAVEETARLLGAHGSLAYVLDPEKEILRFAHDAGLSDIDRRRWMRTLELPLGVGMFGRAVDERRVIVTGDYFADTAFVHYEAADRFSKTVGLRSMVVAPMIAGDRTYGALGTYSRDKDAFGRAEVGLVRALADHVAGAMANALLIEELDRSRAELARRADAERALRDIGARISALRDPADVLQLAVDEAARLLGADGARIDRLEETTGGLYWAYDATTGRRPGLGPIKGKGEAKAGEGISGRAVDEGRAVWTGDYLNDERFEHASAPDRHVRRYGIRSAIAAPLMGDRGALGTLTVYSDAVDAYGSREAHLVEAIAGQAAIAITNARLIDELGRSREAEARRAAAEQALREIAARITAIHDPQDLLQHVVDDSLRLLDADRAQLDLIDEATGLLLVAHVAGQGAFGAPGREDDPGTAADAGVHAPAIATGRVFVTGDYLNDDRFSHVQIADDYVRSVGIRSVMVAPLIGDAGLLGVLKVSSTIGDAYRAEDGELLAAFATQAVVAIQNVHLIEELARSREENARRADVERALREISAEISALRDPNAVLQRTVDEARRLLHSDSSGIDLLVGDVLQWAFFSNAARSTDPGYGSLHIGRGIAGQAVVLRRPVRTGDYLADPTFDHEPETDDFIRRAGIRSALSAPLLGETGPLGALSVNSKMADAYDDAQAELLQGLADQAAIAIQNARLIEDLQRSRVDLETRAETERSLREMAARIAELRDPTEVLERVVEDTRRLLRSDGAHLTRMSDDRTFVYPVIVAGGMDAATRDWLTTQEFPIDAGINGLAAGGGRAIWTEDYIGDQRIPLEADDLDVAERLGLRGMAAVPLRAPEGEIIGTLAVSYSHPRTFDSDEIELLQGLADHAAIAIANTNLYARLRESEQRYRHLVQNSPDLVWAIDGEARFTFVSDTCERLTGWRAEELLGRHFGALLHESSREVAELDWTAGMTAPSQELRGRLNLLHRDGHSIPAEFVALGRLDEEGRFAGANGSVRDMSERDRLERELRESEERWRYLAKASPDVVWAVDEAGHITFMSDRIEPLTGFRPDEVVGQHFRILTESESMAASTAVWEAVQADPSGVYPLTILMPRKHGDPIPVEIWVTGSVRDGRFAGAHGSIRDMRERESFERDLRRQAAELAASDERSHLARELHDSVTQALFSMTLLTRTIELLLERDPQAVRDQLASLRELQREALAEMRALIFELRPGNLEQDGLIHALRTHTAALQGRVGLPIVVTSEAEDRYPIAVEEVLYRVAQEALHNIVKHAAARQVRIDLAPADDGIRLRIEDDGRGFDPDRVPDGHLGLAGMRARAEKIGARLSVRSRSGRGTVVEIVVPQAALVADVPERQTVAAASAE